MSLDDLWSFLADLPLSTAIRESQTLFPLIESIHVAAIVTVVGTISIVDLRLLGVPAHRRSARSLIAELLPFTWIAFALAAVSGVLMFVAKADIYAHNAFFLSKMVLIPLAGANMAAFHLWTMRDIATWDEVLATPPGARLAGGFSLAIWAAVIVVGRWIGFTTN